MRYEIDGNVKMSKLVLVSTGIVNLFGVISKWQQSTLLLLPLGIRIDFCFSQTKTIKRAI